MLSRYFKFKTNTKEFIDNVKSTIAEFEKKKVVICAEVDVFNKLNKQYNFTSKLDIVGYCLYDENNELVKKQNAKNYQLRELKCAEFDNILIMDTNSDGIIARLKHETGCGCKLEYKSLFDEEIKEAATNLEFLLKNKFDKNFPKLVKKMKNKKVVLYGAGIFLELINKYFDISKLNIIGVSDKKYSLVDNNETFLGYKTCNPSEIKDLNPDCVLISTKFYISLFEYLHFDLLSGTKIKVKPLMKKSICTLLKEVMG